MNETFYSLQIDMALNIDKEEVERSALRTYDLDNSMLRTPARASNRIREEDSPRTKSRCTTVLMSAPRQTRNEI